MLTGQAARAAVNRAVVPALVAGLLLVGCSHASSTATAAAPARTKGSVTEGAAAFCSFLTSVNEVAARAASQQQGIQLLASIVPHLQARRAVAPAAVAADFGIVVTAAEQAVAQGNLSPLVTNHVVAAGTKLTSYCHARS